MLLTWHTLLYHCMIRATNRWRSQGLILLTQPSNSAVISWSSYNACWSDSASHTPCQVPKVRGLFNLKLSQLTKFAFAQQLSSKEFFLAPSRHIRWEQTHTQDDSYDMFNATSSNLPQDRETSWHSTTFLLLLQKSPEQRPTCPWTGRPWKPAQDVPSRHSE